MKKLISKITASLCSCLLLICETAVFAEKPVGSYTYKYFTYNINSDSSITLVSCDSNVTAVSIPAEINGMPVSAVNGSTFHDCCNLESITVAEDSKYFCINNDGMLMDKSQTRIIKAPQSLKIHSYSVYDSVKYIAPYCFENCKSLECIYIPETVTSIGKYAFKGTSFSNVTIANRSAVLGEKAFGYDKNYEQIKGFTLYGSADSTAEKYASENNFSFSPSVTDNFNITINGNLYYYYDDSDFLSEKIKITNKKGDAAIYNFSSTPSEIYNSYGADITKVDILSISGNVITSLNVRVAMPGDANADGKLNIRDAAFSASKLAKKQDFTIFEKLCADKNKDGNVNIRDAAETARELAAAAK